MNSNRMAITPRVFVMLLFVLVILPLLPQIISGRWDWWEAWVFSVIFILGFIISRILAVRKTPDLLNERANYMSHDNTQSWDKFLSPIVGLGFAVIVLVAALDERFGWSPSFSTLSKLISVVVIVAGYVVATYALVANSFFSGTVRLQPERGHHVISEGPYRWIRHPGYASALLSYFPIPILLDSTWAFIPVLIVFIAMIIRTKLEDDFLHRELAGYTDYAQRVRYRLLPGIW